MPLILVLVSGALWGLLSAFVTQQAFGPLAWAAAPSGALIGYVIYRLSERYYSRSLWTLIPVAIFTTLIAVALFGLTLGLADLARGIPNRIAWAVVVQGMLACLWGLLFMPFLWVLFPLSFGNHALIRFLWQRDRGA